MTPKPSDSTQASLILTSTCSRLGISVQEAKRRLGWDQDEEATQPPAAPAEAAPATTAGEDLL